MDKITKLEKFLVSHHFYQIMKIGVLVALGLAMFTLAAYNRMEVREIVLVNILVVFTFLCLRYAKFGLYVVVILFPFWGLQFVSGEFNVPYVDLAAVCLFVAMALRTIYVWLHSYFKGHKTKTMEYLKKFPGWQFFIAVAIAGVLAIINNQYPLPAFKYWLRPILFFYLTYILLPVNIIQTKTELKRIMKLMVGTGLVAGVLGLLGVFFGEGFWFLGRAGGLSIFGVNPLGGNHNAVAEVLIAILPMAFVLYILMRKIQHRGWYLLAILFSMGVILLTFSRSGWLALVIMLLILYFARFSKKFDKRSAILVFVVVAIVVLTFYALIWSQVEEVRGSTSSRWLMTGVAWHNFLDRPIIGNGLNTFNEIVGGTFVYFVEFGDPLDSHGFLQKVMTEMGLLGLFSFISMLGYFGYEYVKAYNRAEKKERLIVLGFIMMFCGVVFFQLFSTSYYIVKMWLPIGVGLVGVKLYSQKD